MREIRPSGSVRGAGREARSYRDYLNSDAKQRGLLLMLDGERTGWVHALPGPQKQGTGGTLNLVGNDH